MQNIDPLRFFMIYGIQLTVGGILFLIIALLILRRSRKRLNQIFAMFFISIALSTLFNVIYVPLRNPLVVKALHLITTFFFAWAMVYLLLFNLILLKSKKMIDRKIQIASIAFWTAVLIGLAIIGFAGGVNIDVTTDWKPVWGQSFFIYEIVASMLLMFVPTIYFSSQIYQSFQNAELKKRWKYFLVGIIFYYFIWTGISIVNFLAIELVRSLWNIILLSCFSAFYILYYGVAKQLEE
ncbi:MAG: hypothetical protein EU547_03430 [Promethearchaeota archaeon]|nr:MAG: hypothetical protein EU547_03430 [Candidatus Lokiarchaeota archaeon]